MNDLLNYLRNLTFDELSRVLPDPSEMDWHIYTTLEVASQAHADMIVMSRQALTWYRLGEKLGARDLHSEPFRENGRRHLATIVKMDPTVSSHMELLYETDDEIAFTMK
jgi:hypothetical protein